MLAASDYSDCAGQPNGRFSSLGFVVCSTAPSILRGTRLAHQSQLRLCLCGRLAKGLTFTGSGAPLISLARSNIRNLRHFEFSGIAGCVEHMGTALASAFRNSAAVAASYSRG